MTDLNVNAEMQADNAQQQETIDTPVTNEADKRKKIAYAANGRSIKLEKELQSINQKLANIETINRPSINTEGYDEDHIKLIEQLAERKAEEIIQKKGFTNKQDLSPEALEEQKFLDANMDAYEHIDELRNLKKMFPSRSYSLLYKNFYGGEQPEPQKPANYVGNTNGQTTQPSAKTVDENVDLDNAFDEVMGR